VKTICCGVAVVIGLFLPVEQASFVIPLLTA
jgi:hypothetical protein